MSYRISLPTERKNIIRKNKDGTISIFSQNYHINPDYTKPRKRKIKSTELQQYYRRKDFNLFLTECITSIIDRSPGLLSTINKFSQIKDEYNKRKKEFKRKEFIYKEFNKKEIKELLGVSKSYLNSKPIKKKKKKEVLQDLKNMYDVLQEYLDYINKRPHLSVISKKDRLKFLFKKKNINEKYFDIFNHLVNISKNKNLGEFEDFLKLFLDSSSIKTPDEYLKEQIHDILSNKKYISETISEMLITNPFNFESEDEMLYNMIIDNGKFEHIFNSYIEELYNESKNKYVYNFGKLLSLLQGVKQKKRIKKGKEILDVGRPKVDTTIFYKLFRAIAQGGKLYNLTVSESTALFFYINSNSADGKKLPLNYLHFNQSLREILALSAEGKLDKINDEQKFFFSVAQALYSGIQKLPKSEKNVLFRGENVTPITYDAKPDDLIIYETPVSTSAVTLKTGKIKYTELFNNEISKSEIKVRQGAKTFVRGGGNYVKQNKSILEGKISELYEGQRKFLERVSKDLDSIPQGCLIRIHTDESYIVPEIFKTQINQFQEEHLFLPGTVFKVKKKLKGESYTGNYDHDTSGVYTIVVENIGRLKFSDIFLRR